MQGEAARSKALNVERNALNSGRRACTLALVGSLWHGLMRIVAQRKH